MSEPITHAEKIAWMKQYATKYGFRLALKGEVGFFRECVGIIGPNDCFPDYGPEAYEGVPENAYHKHDCVAVLGRGEAAEAQLYEWLRWFDERGYIPVCRVDMTYDHGYLAELTGDFRRSWMTQDPLDRGYRDLI